MTVLKKAVHEQLSRVAFGDSKPELEPPPSLPAQDFRVKLTETGAFQFGGQNFQVLRHEKHKYWFVVETKTGLGVGEDSKKAVSAVRSAVLTILIAADKANLGLVEYLQSRIDIHWGTQRTPLGIWPGGPRRSIKITVTLGSPSKLERLGKFHQSEQV